MSRSKPCSVLLAITLSAILLVKVGSYPSDSKRCTGRKVLTDPHGRISDGPENYTKNAHCEWLIVAGGPNKTIHLMVDFLQTECLFDYVFVYDGSSLSSPCIARLSGDSQTYNITAYSGHMLIKLISDRGHELGGFSGQYYVYDCPWDCSGHGQCNNHRCHCQAGYSGQACQMASCPNDCGNGECELIRGHPRCRCKPGFAGHACDLPLLGSEGQGRWYVVKDGREDLWFQGRVSHTSVYAADCIWVFGGHDLNLVHDDLYRFCLDDGTWLSLRKPSVQPVHGMESLSGFAQTTSSFKEYLMGSFVGVGTISEKDEVSWPSGRSGHAMDKFGEGFYLYGGLLSNWSTSDELWYFNISSTTWRQCAVSSSIKPPALSGHTLTTAGDYLYLIGGTTRQSVFSDKVFRISAITPNQWEAIMLKGGGWGKKSYLQHASPAWRLSGHSTVYHPHSHSLVVFGGFSAGIKQFSDRINDIMLLDLSTNVWSVLNIKKGGPEPRAFHSAVLLGQYLAVYGGLTHTHYHLEICQSRQLYFYHLGCHRWLNHTHFVGATTMPTRGRFGHSAVVAYGNIMFVFGGFSGQVRSDILAFKVPRAIADFECSQDFKLCQGETSVEESDHCEDYKSHHKNCQDDPECIFCRNGRRDHRLPRFHCIHKERSKLCRSYHTNRDRCPGLCHTLQTCADCVSHGQSGQHSDSHGQSGQHGGHHGQSGQEDVSHGQSGQENDSHGQSGQEDVSHGQSGQEDVSHGQSGQEDVSYGQTGQHGISHGQSGQQNVSRDQSGQHDISEGPSGQIDRNMSLLDNTTAKQNGTSMSQAKRKETEENMADQRHRVTPQRKKWRTYPQKCRWCVKEGECQPQNAPSETCKGVAQTDTGMPGWWKGLSDSLSSLHQCQTRDLPAGLTHIISYDYVNRSFPDEVRIVREAHVRHDPDVGHNPNHDPKRYESRLVGFLHPDLVYSADLKLYLSATEAGVTMYVSTDSTEENKEQVLSRNVSNVKKRFPVNRASGQPLFQNVTRNSEYLIEQGTHVRKRSDVSKRAAWPQTETSILWNAVGVLKGSNMDEWVISPEFLEPYSSGNCSIHFNCLGCLTDALCGWCQVNNTCLSRQEATECYLITSPSDCTACKDNLDCSSCTENPLCEWHAKEYGKCRRRYRWKEEDMSVIRNTSECEVPCHERGDCISCMEGKECSWCKDLGLCLRDHLTVFPYGQCAQWKDNPEQKDVIVREACKTCEQHKTCDICLSHVGCGWCSLAHDPLHGICVQGDFAGLEGNVSCSHLLLDMDNYFLEATPSVAISTALVMKPTTPDLQIALGTDCMPTNSSDSNTTIMEGGCVTTPVSTTSGQMTSTTIVTASAATRNVSLPRSVWSYDRCPDIDECLLENATDCHANATCINTDGSYLCICDQGFMGNGSHCARTCYHSCVNGDCMGPPSYECNCTIGWTGPACDVDCLCHGKSKCEKEGPGVCDECTDNTTGPRCSQCAKGAYGDPTTAKGCQECYCNGHEDRLVGSCNRTNGNCFCKDNTEGKNCEICRDGFFGDPRNGGQCYRQCEGRTFLWNAENGAVGLDSQMARSDRERRSSGGNPLIYCLWIITVYPEEDHIPDMQQGRPTYEISVSGDFSCGKNSVYVYDGVPAFISAQKYSQSLQLGTFCARYSDQPFTVYATSGVITIIYEGELADTKRDFTVKYKALKCDHDSPCSQNQRCEDGVCVCKNGFIGPMCQNAVCLRNCSGDQGQQCYSLDQGCQCDNSSCANMTLNFTTPGAHILTDSTLERYPLRLPNKKSKAEDKQALLLGQRVSSPSPRAGHSLTVCDKGLILLYGGFSSQTGILQDTWLYNVHTGVWTELTMAANPGPRYYHSAACIPRLDTVYIVGGITDNDPQITNSMWKFDMVTHVWTEVHTPAWLPGLAGHSLTRIGQGDNDSLVIIGGYSNEGMGLDKVYMYNATKRQDRWGKVQLLSPTSLEGIYGHSAEYDSSAHVVYVFGGYHVESGRSNVSDVLFAYSIDQNIFSKIKDNSNFRPESRAFHTSVTFDNMMLIIGGVDRRGRVTNTLLLYMYGCNTWTKFTLKETINVTAALGVSAVLFHNNIYMFGGFTGSSLGTMTLVRLHSDLCTVLTDHGLCSIGACDWNKTSASCVNKDGRRPCDTENTNFMCRRHTQCFTCLHQQPKQMCKWCPSCSNMMMGSSCIPEKVPCNLACPSDVEAVTHARDCAYFPRPRRSRPDACWDHTSCQSCLNSAHSYRCLWSEALGQCMSEMYIPLRCSLGECQFVRTEQKHCPAPCYAKDKCASCLASPGCGWCANSDLNGGGHCMEGGVSGPSGGRVCRMGNVTLLTPPLTSITSQVKGEFNFKTIENVSRVSWEYDLCPTENECKNGHHTCDKDTQDCFDKLHSYDCRCKEGYTSSNSGRCVPTCHSGCSEMDEGGYCVGPDKCKCRFGRVGPSCHVKCLCNGHSNCQDENNTSNCTRCLHNTQGEQCEECKPFFVGDPRIDHNTGVSGSCISCKEYCHNHTDICISNPRSEEQHLFASGMYDHRAVSIQRKGPKKDVALCIKCKDNTTGAKCHVCNDGHFRKPDAEYEYKGEKPPPAADESDLRWRPCIPCQCNGHSYTCNPKTGKECSCANNTQTKCEEQPDKPCYAMQCALCMEYFHGNPVNGYQCYRQMNADRDYCFDPTTQNNCNQYPLPLLQGRTVFFMVQPKYLNVDIRITIDVIAGKSDIFLSDKDDTFQVFVDRTTGIHEVYLDQNAVTTRSGLSRRSVQNTPRDEDPVAGRDRQEKRAPSLYRDSRPDPGKSIRITDSVPSHLRMHPSDANYYKLSQFRSLDAEDEDHKMKERHLGGETYLEMMGKVLDGESVSWSERWMPWLDRKREKNAQHELDEDMRQTRRLVRQLLKSPTSYNTSTFDSAGRRSRSRRAITVTDRRRKQNKLSEERRGWIKQRRRSSGGTSGKTRKMGEIEAGKLNTYVTVGEHNSVLVVRNVQFRLVITLPRDQHNLRSSRFYIIVRSLEGGPASEALIQRASVVTDGDAGLHVGDAPTRGSLFFRQDQPHINLFVFFSVFFSCFFLFLAACVLLWKMKQTLDARRSRQLQEREMECMASRPFATILVLLEPQGDALQGRFEDLARQKSKLLQGGRPRQHHHNHHHYHHHYQQQGGRNVQCAEVVVGGGGGDGGITSQINAIVTSNSIVTLSSLAPPPPPPRSSSRQGLTPIGVEPTEDGQAAVATVVLELPGGASAPTHLCLGSVLTTKIGHGHLSGHGQSKGTSLRRRTSMSFY